MSRWPTIAIADFAKTSAGGTPSKTNRAFYDAGTIPWLLSGEVGVPRISSAKNRITEAGLKGSSAKLFPSQTVLVAMYGATAGEVGVLDFESATNQAVCGILPGAKHVPEFLYYYLLLAKPNLVSQAIGNAQPNISQAKVKSLKIPLPPLKEQKRIVAVLDQAFAALDRASALAKANLADAEALFGAAVDAVIHRLANGRERSLRLGSIVTRLTNGFVGPTRDIYFDDGVPYLLARHVRNNELTFDGKTYVSETFNEKNSKSKLKADDVLLVQSGHIGHSAVVPEKHAGHNCHAMIVLTTIKEVLSGEYLSAIFNTPQMQERFQAIRTGSTVPHLTCGMVKELLLPVPPVEVQDAVLSEIRVMRQQSASLESKYAHAVAELADLRQSLLQKAFAGELT